MLPANVDLRTESEADESFLRELYAQSYGQSLAMLPVPEAQKRTLLEMQFQAQTAHYRRHYPDASFDIICYDRQPSGRLCVSRGQGEMRVVDLALTTSMRGRGIGTAILRTLIEEARRENCPLRLRVEPWNPARGLYTRLGFELEEEEMAYVGMVWRPAGTEPAGPGIRQAD